MSDHIELQIGAAPWQPDGNTSIIEELDRYNVPTMGILEQHGVMYCFELIEGHVQDMNVWIYTPLSKVEAKELCRASGQEIDTLLARMQQDRPVMAALAAENAIQQATAVKTEGLDTQELVATAVRELRNLLQRERAGLRSLTPAGT